MDTRIMDQISTCFNLYNSSGILMKHDTMVDKQQHLWIYNQPIHDTMVDKQQHLWIYNQPILGHSTCTMVS